MMRGTVNILTGVAVLAAFSAAAMAGATNHWQLDGNTNDAVGSNHGSVVGNHSWSADVSDVAIYDPLSGTTRPNTGSADFAGGGGATNTGINVGVLTTGNSYYDPYTVEVIFKTPDQSNKAEQSIFGHWQGADFRGMIQALVFGTDPNAGWSATEGVTGVHAAVGFPDGAFPVTHGDVSDGQWHHVAMTYSHTGDIWEVAADPTPADYVLTCELWVDYQLIASDTHTWPGEGAGARLQQSDWGGHRIDVTAPTYIAGGIGPNPNPITIDEVRVLDYAVTADPLDHFLQPVPEPATLGLLGVGGVLAVLRRRR